jgi:REP element-mobilizing transposase RayT
MGRRARHDPEDGWHHVMNRGAARRDVFHAVRDGRQFLRLVGEGVAMSTVEVHAYCLMSNHFHLLLHCPEGGLSAFMHRLGSMYTRYVNTRLASDGAIFRGRYHSILVDSPEYRLCAGRYIHRNPSDLGREVVLDRYPWSSYAAYVGARPVPTWLTTANLLAMYGSAEAMRTSVEDDAAAGCVPIGWAIETALAESDDRDLDGTPHIRRAIALALLDRCSASRRPDLVAWLGFTSDQAQATAVARSRRRTAAVPALAAVAERANALLADR